jgi:hypothetical protein
MLQFSKISLVVVFCAVAVLVAPPAARAEPQIQVFFKDVPQLSPPPTGKGGTVTFSGTINTSTTPFTVSLTGTSNQASGGAQGALQLMAMVTGGGKDTITIQLTDTNYTQTGPTEFREKVHGTITGAGSVKFQAFLNNSGMVTSLDLLGPFPRGRKDATYSGSSSTNVTGTSQYSMTLSSAITGGDVSFTFFATNTQNTQ